jgi:membrane protease YdiL (CAAX protease family)
MCTGRVPLRFRPQAGFGHLYGETFALWFVGFIAMQMLVGAVAPRQYLFPGLIGTFFASLVFLFWPVIRGIRWPDVRADIGWMTRARWLIEAAFGVAGYVCVTPLIAVALVFTAVLAQMLQAINVLNWAQVGGRNTPSHPIVFELANGSPAVILIVFVLACVAAPIIEETMFRGVLYRHLRDSTQAVRRIWSIAFSAGFNSLIFAAIHPQGLLGIPLLGTLAFGISIVREWRESLIAPMVMHGLNNGLMLTILIAMLQTM